MLYNKMEGFEVVVRGNGKGNGNYHSGRGVSLRKGRREGELLCSRAYYRDPVLHSPPTTLM